MSKTAKIITAIIVLACVATAPLCRYQNKKAWEKAIEEDKQLLAEQQAEIAAKEAGEQGKLDLELNEADIDSEEAIEIDAAVADAAEQDEAAANKKNNKSDNSDDEDKDSTASDNSSDDSTDDKKDENNADKNENGSNSNKDKTPSGNKNKDNADDEDKGSSGNGSASGGTANNNNTPASGTQNAQNGGNTVTPGTHRIDPATGEEQTYVRGFGWVTLGEATYEEIDMTPNGNIIGY